MMVQNLLGFQLYMKNNIQAETISTKEKLVQEETKQV